MSHILKNRDFQIQHLSGKYYGADEENWVLLQLVFTKIVALFRDAKDEEDVLSVASYSRYLLGHMHKYAVQHDASVSLTKVVGSRANELMMLSTNGPNKTTKADRDSLRAETSVAFNTLVEALPPAAAQRRRDPLTMHANAMLKRFGLSTIKITDDVIDPKAQLSVLSEHLRYIANAFELKESAVGLGSRIGLRLFTTENPFVQGNYDHFEKTINTQSGSPLSTTVHEWGHALDNLIGQDISGRNTHYASLFPKKCVELDCTTVEQRRAHRALQKIVERATSTIKVDKTVYLVEHATNIVNDALAIVLGEKAISGITLHQPSVTKDFVAGLEKYFVKHPTIDLWNKENFTCAVKDLLGKLPGLQHGEFSSDTNEIPMERHTRRLYAHFNIYCGVKYRDTQHVSYQDYSQAMDEGLGSRIYYAQKHECFARIMEAYALGRLTGITDQPYRPGALTDLPRALPLNMRAMLHTMLASVLPENAVSWSRQQIENSEALTSTTFVSHAP